MSPPDPSAGGGASGAPTGAGTPGLWRRTACLVYEGMLLFAVVMIAGYLYSALTQQRHALQGQTGLQAFLFLIIGIYFIGFWTRGGQTLAMKTWHIRLVDAEGRGVTQRRAGVRYLLGWIWVLPVLAAAGWSGELRGWALAGGLAGWMAAYSLLALALPGRQYAHDLLCGTRLVTHRPPAPLRGPGAQ